MPVVVSSIYNTNNVNAGEFAGSELWSVLNAGICSHSSGAGAVPVMDSLRKSCISTIYIHRYQCG